MKRIKRKKRTRVIYILFLLKRRFYAQEPSPHHHIAFNTVWQLFSCQNSKTTRWPAKRWHVACSCPRTLIEKPKDSSIKVKFTIFTKYGNFSQRDTIFQKCPSIRAHFVGGALMLGGGGGAQLREPKNDNDQLGWYDWKAEGLNQPILVSQNQVQEDELGRDGRANIDNR